MMSEAQRADRIVSVFVGDANTPEDSALKRAATEHVLRVLAEETPLTESESLRGFIAEYVHELALVELEAGLDGRELELPAVEAAEERLREFIDEAAMSVEFADEGRVTDADMTNAAESVLRDTLDWMRFEAEAEE